MDHNILLNISNFIDSASFINFIKAFPYLIKDCYYFKSICDVNIENKQRTVIIIINKPQDISLYERVVNTIKKM